MMADWNLAYHRLDMTVQGYRWFSSAVLLMPLLWVGCGGPPASVKAWDDEVTGVVAQVNDVIALQFLPASLGVPEGETPTFVDGSEAKPDLARVAAACTRLTDTAGLYGPLAADPPPEREATAFKVRELQRTLATAAAACIASAEKGDLEAYARDRALLAPEWVTSASNEPESVVGRGWRGPGRR